jgi:1,4-alpha-glucan branching enzyme
MTAAARKHASTSSPFVERTLRQLARELLLAQSSDWAFLMKTGTAVEYATRRTKDHLLRFTRLHEMLESGIPDEPLLEACEERDNLFPNVNWKHYL